MLPSLQSVSSIKMNQDIESSDRLPSFGTIRHNTKQIKTNRKVSRLSTNRSTSVDSIQESRSRRVNGDSIKTDSNHQSTRCYTDRQKEGDLGGGEIKKREKDGGLILLFDFFFALSLSFDRPLCVFMCEGFVVLFVRRLCVCLLCACLLFAQCCCMLT